MSAFETLIYEKTRGNRLGNPQSTKVLNIYNVRMRDDLFEVLCSIKDDPEVRVVVLKGRARRPSVPGRPERVPDGAPPVEARRVRFEARCLGALSKHTQTLHRALHGFVLGSGIEMALCCDIRIASDDARFGLPEAALGIIPAAGGTQTLRGAVERPGGSGYAAFEPVDRCR